MPIGELVAVPLECILVAHITGRVGIRGLVCSICLGALEPVALVGPCVGGIIDFKVALVEDIIDDDILVSCAVNFICDSMFARGEGGILCIYISILTDVQWRLLILVLTSV
jgi:hypothetical protein